MIDLHTHSYFSDGELSPSQLVAMAKDKGISTLALTDHDTLSGLEEAKNAANACGMQFISGIELSVKWRQHELHILGLNIDKDAPPLTLVESRQKEARLNRAIKIGEQLENASISGAFLGAKRFAGQGEITRPHFAKYLIEQKKVKDMKAAFKQYLGRGKVGFVKTDWVGLEEAVSVILQARGVAVIAHPLRYGLTRTKLIELIEEFKSYGGLGLEVVSGQSIEKERDLLQSLCRRYELLASLGSDFHSPEVKPVWLGNLASISEQLPKVWQCF